MGILSPDEVKKLFEKLDKLGIEKVQDNLDWKCYGRRKIKLVHLWMERKEKERLFNQK